MILFNSVACIFIRARLYESGGILMACRFDVCTGGGRGVPGYAAFDFQLIIEGHACIYLGVSKWRLAEQFTKHIATIWRKFYNILDHGDSNMSIITSSNPSIRRCRFYGYPD